MKAQNFACKMNDKITTVQKLDVPGPDEKFCLCWLCPVTTFSSGGAIFPVHLIFEQS